MWTTNRTICCSPRTSSISRCLPSQSLVQWSARLLTLRFTRRSNNNQGQSTMKMLRFLWSTTTFSARYPCRRSSTSSRLSITWRQTARKVLIWSSTVSSDRARATHWSLWTCTCPSVTVSRRLRWSETTWKSRRKMASLSPSSPTCASSQLNSKQWRKWHRSWQLSMSTRFSLNRYSKQEFSNYCCDQAYSETEK